MNTLARNESFMMPHIAEMVSFILTINWYLRLLLRRMGGRIGSYFFVLKCNKCAEISN